MANLNYYQCRKVMSYGTPFIFTLGNRSIGKTFAFTSYCINRYLKTGRKFIYMRRYDEDLVLTAPTYFDSVREKYTNVSLEVDGSGKTGKTRFLINGNLAGITISLSKGFKYKSVNLCDYDTIMYDEFINEDNKYLPEEVAKCLSFYQSVARGFGKPIREEVKFIFIGNHVSLNNPYFRELKIRDKVNIGSRYCVDEDRAWVLELTDNVEIANAISTTPFGKMIAKTKYGEYAVKSQFYLDDNTFIQKPSGKSKYIATLKHHDSYYGVYDYHEEGLFYVSSKADKEYPVSFSLTTKDHQPNYLLLFRNRANPVFSVLKFAFDNALLRFDNADSKLMFLDFMSYSNNL